MRTLLRDPLLWLVIACLFLYGLSYAGCRASLRLVHTTGWCYVQAPQRTYVAVHRILGEPGTRLGSWLETFYLPLCALEVRLHQWRGDPPGRYAS